MTSRSPARRPIGGPLFRSALGAIFAMSGSTACSSTSSPSAAGATAQPEASAPSLCDPFAPPPTQLGTILGVGADDPSILYVADQPPDGGGQDRVFVSNGTTLYRQHVSGTGGIGAAPNADDVLDFQSPAEDAGVRTLVIQIRGGVVTGMALVAGASRSSLGDPDAGQVPLRVVPDESVVGFAVQNLPNVVEHAADVSDGHVIVVIAPMDPYGSSAFRLFYGTAGAMIEYPIVSVGADSYGEYVTFVMNGARYGVFFNDPFLVSLDGGALPKAGPGSLYADDGGAGDPAFNRIPGAFDVTERPPGTDSVAGLAFMCRGD